MLELNQETFQDFIKGETPALVDFWAPWCMPCRIFAPVLEDLSDELDGKVEFGKVNIDDHPDLASQYGITTIPTIILFQQGKPVTQMIGVHSREKVLSTITSHL